MLSSEFIKKTGALMVLLVSSKRHDQNSKFPRLCILLLKHPLERYTQPGAISSCMPSRDVRDAEADEVEHGVP